MFPTVIAFPIRRDMLGTSLPFLLHLPLLLSRGEGEERLGPLLTPAPISPDAHGTTWSKHLRRTRAVDKLFLPDSKLLS